MATLKNIQIEKIIKGDLIDIKSLDSSKLDENINLDEFKEVRVERINTDNPHLRQNRTFTNYFQLILVFKDEIDISDRLCIKNSRSKRVTYKKV